MICKQCRACRTQPNSLFITSSGLMTPGICYMIISPTSLKSWMAKNLKAILRVHSIGEQLLFMIFKAERLSI